MWHVACDTGAWLVEVTLEACVLSTYLFCIKSFTTDQHQTSPYLNYSGGGPWTSWKVQQLGRRRGSSWVLEYGTWDLIVWEQNQRCIPMVTWRSKPGKSGFWLHSYFLSDRVLHSSSPFPLHSPSPLRLNYILFYNIKSLYILLVNSLQRSIQHLLRLISVICIQR